MPAVASHTFVAADFGFTDADASNSFTAVRIDTVPTGGVLALNGVTVAAPQTIALADLSNLVFTATDNSGAASPSPSFTFSVQDENGLFSTAPSTLTFTVTGTNDAPTGTDKTVAITEPGAGAATHAFAASDFGRHQRRADGNGQNRRDHGAGRRRRDARLRCVRLRLRRCRP
ncbi:hypothetical protein ASF26_21600 [Methylobacterium sp. Leaf93]|nr:hypothetical protein ASF26_21600 [Methylobacterium sp. Leaf93]